MDNLSYLVNMSNEKLSIQVGNRMLEERTRLGLSQSDAGEIAGVSRVMWGRYERVGALPGGEVWLALVASGFDVGYILTGSRGGEVLDVETRELIRRFVSADAVTKQLIWRVLGGGAPGDVHIQADTIGTVLHGGKAMIKQRFGRDGGS